MSLAVIINNFNYAEFLPQAIESAIAYTQADEIVVVDDGSTDNSVQVARKYSPKVRVIEKDNNGQASTFNRGLLETRSNWIYFLDADDVVFESFLKYAQMFRQLSPTLSMVAFRLTKFGRGVPMLEPKDCYKLPHGDCRDCVLNHNYAPPPTSGLIFNRRFLNAVAPIPEETYRLCADAFLSIRAPFYGEIHSLAESLAGYRLHASNNYARASRATKLPASAIESLLARAEDRVAFLSSHAQTNQGRKMAPEHFLPGNVLVAIRKASRTLQTSHASPLAHAVGSLGWLTLVKLILFRPTPRIPARIGLAAKYLLDEIFSSIYRRA